MSIKFNKILRFTLILSSLLTVYGCTVIPGARMSIGDKTVVETADEELDLDRISVVYPITYSLLQQLNSAGSVQKSQSFNTNSPNAGDYSYKIGSGDILDIRLWNIQNVNMTIGALRDMENSGVSVDSNGYIFYPLVGRFQVKGKTIPVVRTQLTAALRKYIVDPQLDVSVAQFRSQQVSVTGSVRNAGQFPITTVPMTVLDIVSLAGGFMPDADTRNIKWTHNGKLETLSLQDLIQEGDVSQNRLLAGGDIVYIPSAENSPVYVMGEVVRQANVTIDNTGLSLTAALGKVSGMDQALSDATGVFVIRNMPNDINRKPFHIYQLDLSDATAYGLGTQFMLQPQDVVYVTAAPVALWSRVMSQLIPTVDSGSSVRSSTN